LIVKYFFGKKIISEIQYTITRYGFNYQTDTEYIQTTHIHINFKQILKYKF